MVQKIKTIPHVSCLEPNGAFYVFLDISRLFGCTYEGQKIANSMDFATLLLEKAHVALVPGSAFGAPAYVRLSYALSLEQAQKGLTRLEQFIRQLD